MSTNDEFQRAVKLGYATVIDTEKNGTRRWTCEPQYQKYCWENSVTRIQVRKIGRTDDWFIQLWQPPDRPFTKQDYDFFEVKYGIIPFEYWNWYAVTEEIYQLALARSLAEMVAEYFEGVRKLLQITAKIA